MPIGRCSGCCTVGLSPTSSPGPSMGELVAFWAPVCVVNGKAAMATCYPGRRDKGGDAARGGVAQGQVRAALAGGAVRESPAELDRRAGRPRRVSSWRWTNCNRQRWWSAPPEADGHRRGPNCSGAGFLSTPSRSTGLPHPLFVIRDPAVREPLPELASRHRAAVYSCKRLPAVRRRSRGDPRVGITHWPGKRSASRVVPETCTRGCAAVGESGAPAKPLRLVEDVSPRDLFVADAGNGLAPEGLTQLNHLLGGLEPI